MGSYSFLVAVLRYFGTFVMGMVLVLTVVAIFVAEFHDPFLLSLC